VPKQLSFLYFSGPSVSWAEAQTVRSCAQSQLHGLLVFAGLGRLLGLLGSGALAQQPQISGDGDVVELFIVELPLKDVVIMYL
jgi:hypothetical protein